MKYTKRQVANAIIKELKFARDIKKIIMEGEAGAADVEAEEEEAAADASTKPDAEVEEPTEEPAEEPTEEPTEEPEEEEEAGTEEELIEITDDYIKKLRNSQATVDQSDIVELMSMVIDSFGYGNQEKLSVLQGVKEATIR